MAAVVNQLLPAAPIVPANGTAFTSFSQLYSDESKDPCQRNYARIMHRIDPNRNDAIASEVLFQQAVGLGGSAPQAYLCCGTTNNGPKIYCSHLPSKFLGALDGTPTLWDNLSFAFLGEVVQGLDNLTDLPVLPPVLQDDEAEEVTVRNYVFLPAVYIPLVLNSKGYTPKQLWEVLHPALVQRQELDVCLPLVQWMQAASMGTATLQPLEMGDPIITLPLTSPTADELLLAHRHAILHQALPGLKAPPPSLETALTHATALIAQTNDNWQAREQKAAEDQEPKLPSARFAVTLPVLLEYLQLPDEQNLPNLWHQWSDCSKQQEIQVLHDALDAFSRSANAYSSAVPIVTARLTQDLLRFSFVGQSADDLKNGLHPFIISYGNAENRQTNLEVARLYGLLTAGDGTCSLADLETLNSKEVKSIQLTYWELETSLGMFGNLLAVVLGLQHPLTAAFQDMWTLMRSNIWEDLHMALEYTDM
jgi:hypothetical protein